MGTLTNRPIDRLKVLRLQSAEQGLQTGQQTGVTGRVSCSVFDAESLLPLEALKLLFRALVTHIVKGSWL